jgi:hypothetical protein
MRVETARPADETAIRRLFRSTIALGHPLPFEHAGLEVYEGLSLDWYLRAEPGARVGVLRDRDRVLGYALVCLDPVAFDEWQRAAAKQFLRVVLPRLAARRYPKDVRRFYRLRLRDGYQLWRHGGAPTGLPHAHLNAAPEASGSLPGRMLTDFIDDVCRDAGYGAWCGEINARAGRRTAGIARWGARVVHRAPNHTLTWLRHEPVERLTVVRDVSAAPRRAAEPEAA